MKRLLIVFFLSLGIVPMLVGQNKSDKVFKLIELIDGQTSIQGILNSVKPQLIQKLDVQFVGKDSLKKAEDYDKYVSELLKQISEKLIKEELFQTFDNNFSESELDTIIAFYETQAGQKTLKINAVLKEILTSALINKHLLDLKTKMIQRYNEIK